MSSRAAWTIFLAAPAFAFLRAYALTPQLDRKPTAPPAIAARSNPHHTADQCMLCHATREPDYQLLAGAALDAVCLECHDGITAPAEPHPIARGFNRADIRRPPDWPAPDGLLSCITCHDLTAGGHPADYNKKQTDHWLRPLPSAASDFCAACHAPDAHARANPHAMMIHADRQSDACLLCHQELDPQSSLAERLGDPRLHQSEIALCSGCHGNHVDFFTPGHIGATVTPHVLARMRATDAAHGLVSSDGPQLLPLLPDGRVGCSTCHNPHPHGVFPADSILARGAPPQFPASGVALRMSGSELCVACHAP